MRKTIARTRKFTRNLPHSLPPEAALDELARVLQLPAPPNHMECFDISHISGTFCVASMVVFRNGRADKNQYRRFRIRSFVGNDDFRAMEEVVGRRYRRLSEENSPMPDLVIIDGGKGQLSSALRAFLAQGLEPPPMIGLAKKEETIIFSDERLQLQLPVENVARRLLQQIRDEAHRFANSFNADLRSRKLRESILDGFTGLGSKRKQLLLKHFGSLQAMRQASVESLSQVEGIGPMTAQRLWEFLHASADL
ncbi:MAG: helix-hairpin-helix domain-containing protein [Verrucomicrobia bacterium]|nr:helix-hairpin-helix domain-containing protein [Verrucomicrobiota bacterium]